MRRTLSSLGLLLAFTVSALAGSDSDWLLPTGDGGGPALPALSEDIPSPEDFLGYPLGRRFTHHHRIVEYMRHLATVSERVSIWEYGESYEHRPLVLVAISSPGNLARLEEIRTEHLRRANVLGNGADEDQPVLAWLSYGIHGNEVSSSEAAMAAAYVLAAGLDDWPSRLSKTIVLIDPLTNPDGRERYVSFYETRAGRLPDPYAAAAEHREAWPGGRQNHYLVDLNRDWAWLTQQETRYRMREYRRWEPHVYVDFHEMSWRSTYFFPPAADPVHPAINSAIVDWLEVFGAANADTFDRRGWLYYTGEDFDLFYPGYGDSYPSLRGAVGMTYEMAGHGAAGLTVLRPAGAALTLADRIARHLATSLTTIATATEHGARLRDDFVRRRLAAATTGGKTYVWDHRQSEAAAAAELLAAHGLEPRRLGSDRSIPVSPLAGGEEASRSFGAGSWHLSTAHYLAPLAESLMEPRAQMPPSFLDEQRRRLEQNLSTDFFDITAWSIPTAFNLEVYSTTTSLTDLHGEAETTPLEGSGSFGFLVPPQGLAGYRFVGELLFRDVDLRLALAEFSQGDQRYERGTVFIPARGNRPELATEMLDLAVASGVRVVRTRSARTASGISLGSNEFVTIEKPRIGLLQGVGVSPTSFGFLWHLLDRQLETPHHRLDVGALDRTRLADFDVLVMPSGSYEDSLDEEDGSRLVSWIEEGGILVAIGGAVSWVQARELTAVETWEPSEDAEGAKTGVVAPDRREISTPGAALATVVSPRPLTVGLATAPPLLFRGKKVLLATGDPATDLVVADPENPVLAGFAWPEAQERLKRALLVSAETKGRGAVVLFAQDPVFRLFWRGTAPPFLNAVLYGPSLAASRRLRE